MISIKIDGAITGSSSSGITGITKGLSLAVCTETKFKILGTSKTYAFLAPHVTFSLALKLNENLIIPIQGR